MSSNSFLISVIDIGIDIKLLISDCKIILDEYSKLNLNTDTTKPYSIVLTENANFTERRKGLISYEDVHNKSYFDRDNEATLKENYKNTSLAKLIQKLPFPFSIMRLSVLPPNTIITMHTDKSCHAQIAIVTNKDSFVAAQTGETKHIPADGKLYIISTTIPHTAFNASNMTRVHLSISIFDEDYVKLLRSK